MKDITLELNKIVSLIKKSHSSDISEIKRIIKGGHTAFVETKNGFYYVSLIDNVDKAGVWGKDKKDKYGGHVWINARDIMSVLAIPLKSTNP